MAETNRNEKLYQARKDKGWTQEEAAAKIGVTSVTFSRWERNEQPPQRSLHEKICEVFGVKGIEELGISPPTRTSKSFTVFTVPTDPPMHLPQLTGRDDAIAEVCALLQNSHIRLLTLTGAPGIGKTSLALRVREKLDNKRVEDKSIFAHGTFFVPLDTISEHDEGKIVTAIARELKLEDPGAIGLDDLKIYLQDKHMLLILDNCEHLKLACAKLAETLLRSCPTLTMLTTSTERLRIEEETVVWHVLPLEYPDLKEHLPPINRLREYSAIELFETQRRKVRPEFTITDKNAHAIAQICARLDGHTLAIRLAAGLERPSEWQIEERLNNCLPLLIGGNRTDAERHETILKTIEWRYDLLSEIEKTLLQRLSVFRGGWSEEAAKVVCAGDGLRADDIPGMLEYLARKSLIDVVRHEKTTRDRLLEIIRQYTYRRLRDTGKAEGIHRRHRGAFFQMAEEYAQFSDPVPEAVRVYTEAEYENLQTALKWCLDEEDNGETLLEFVANLIDILVINGGQDEGVYWLAKAIENDTETELTLDETGFLASAQDDFKIGDNLPEAYNLFEKALQHYTEQDDKKGEATCLLWLGHIDLLEGNYQDALISLKKSLTLYFELDNSPRIAQSLAYLGITMLRLENYTEAAAFLEDSLELFVLFEDNVSKRGCLLGIAEIAHKEGWLEHALHIYLDTHMFLLPYLARKTNLIFSKIDKYISNTDMYSA